MTPNQPYSSAALMRYQMSLLSLAAALDQSLAEGSSEIPAGALKQAERLKEKMDRPSL